MNRDPILFRVDASPEAGYERFSRCLTYAVAIQRRRRPIYFLSKLEPNSLAMGIKRAGHDWIAMNHAAGTMDDAKAMKPILHKLKPAAVITDIAEMDQQYLHELDRHDTMLVSLDHQAVSSFPSQLIINPLLGPARESYEFNRGTQLLMGRRYALVRPEVRRLRSARSQEPAMMIVQGKPQGQYRALLALGEDDPNRQSLSLAKMLLGTPKLGRVDVIARREHPDYEALQAMVEANPDRLELATDPAEVAAKVVRCHFALTSGSGWSLELACIGVPQLLLLQNEVHWPNAQRLEEEGCATILGWHESVSAATMRQGIQNLLSDPLERQAMARTGRALIDGRGPDRLVTALEVMLSPSRSADVLRMAA